MAEKRTCGGCTACCKTHSVLSIVKAMSVWCQHCNIGKGCKIYVDRPCECKNFVCQWLKGYGDEKRRPDKSKVVVDFYRVEELEEDVASFWETSEGALERKFAKAATQELLASNISVLHIYLGGREVLYTKKTLAESRRQLLTEDGMKIVQR